MKKTAFFLALISSFVFSNPQGMDAVFGSATFSEEGNTLKIEAADKSIINWNSFSIGSKEKTSFELPSSASVVLNRVTGNIKSEILGSLLSNGKVYLINPSGIFIGPGAVISTNSFLASTYDILDKAFLSQEDLLFTGGSEEKLINLGTIKAWDGDVILIGRHVENLGKVEANKGDIKIGVGKEILLKIKEKEGIYIKPFFEDGEADKDPGIINEGELDSTSTYLKADGYMYSLAIKDSGKIDALAFEEKEGQIFLVAEGGRVESSGKMSARKKDTGGEVRFLGKEVGLLDEAQVDVSGKKGGGTVLLGGNENGKLVGSNPIGSNPIGSNAIGSNADAVFLGKDVKIKADSLEENNGGKVVLFSNLSTVFLGQISAEAKGKSGDGGLVEVSSLEFLAPHGRVSTKSLNGKWGTYLIDPCDINIKAGPIGGSFPAFPTSGNDYYPTISPANLTNLDLQNGLAANNVTVSTNAGTGGSGDITIAAPLLLAGNGALTLSADQDILNNQIITLGTQPLTMNAKRNIDLTDGQITGGTASVSLTAGGDISVIGLASAAQINCSNNITLNATGNVIIGSSSAGFSSNVQVAGAGAISITAGVALSVFGGNSPNSLGQIKSAGGTINITSPTVTFLGGSASPAGALIDQNAGTVSLSQPSGATSGGVNITGGTAIGTNAGIYVKNGGTINISTVGDVILTAGTFAEAAISSGNVAGAGNVNLTAKDIILNGSSGASSNAYINGRASGNMVFTVNSINLSSGTGGYAKIYTGAGTSNITGTVANGITIVSNGAVASIDTSFSAGLGDINLTKTGPISMTSSSGSGGCFIISGGVISLAETSSITMVPSSADTIIKTVNASKDITINSASAPGSGGLSFNSLSSPHIAAIYTDNGGNITLYFSGAGSITAGIGNSVLHDCGIMTGYTSGSGNITGSLGSLSMLGGTSTLNGLSSAKISTGYALNTNTGGGDIDLTFSSLLMTGGIGNSNHSEIMTGTLSGTIKITSSGSINVNGGTGSNCFSQIATSAAYPSGTLNINSPSLTLKGGSGSSSTALLGGTDLIIDDQTLGSLSLIGGSGSNARAEILASNNITINSSNLTMQGGSGPGTGAYAFIAVTGTGFILFPLIQEMNLSGGSTSDSYATISSSTGDITINSTTSPQGYLNMTGGSATNTYAEIISTGGDIQANFAMDVNLTGGTGPTSYSQITALGGNVDLILRDISLTGSLSDNTSFAAIIAANVNASSSRNIILTSNAAYAYVQYANNIMALGSITLNGTNSLVPAIQAEIITKGGLTANIYAGNNINLLGRSSITSALFPPPNTSINIFAGRSMSLMGQNGSAAVFGYDAVNVNVLNNLSLIGSSTGAFTATIQGTGQMNINTGSAELIGGNFPAGGSSAFISTINGNLNLNVFDSNLDLIGGPGFGSGAFITAPSGLSSIFVQGLLEMFSTGLGQAFIGSNGYNSFHVNRDILLIGNPAGGVYIKDFSNNNFSVSSAGNITLIDYAEIENVGGNLTILAGNNLVVTANSKIVNDTSSDLTLVVDNNYPTYPNADQGQFNLSVDSTVTNTPTGSGKVRIFTVLPQFNIIQGLINGYSFVPGPDLIDSLLERWGVYYPSSFFGGPGFTIFYKVSQPFLRTIMGAAMLASSELFFRLNNMKEDFYVMDYYDRYIRRAKVFCVGYDQNEYRGLEEYQTCDEYTIYLRFD